MKDFREHCNIFLSNNKKTLIISAGDSWTFGDSLGTIEKNPWVDDYHARSTQSYGRLVADELSADWLNFGLCGGGNYSVLQFLSNTILGHHYRFLTQENYSLIRASSWPTLITEVLDNEHEHRNIIKELQEVHCRSFGFYNDKIKTYDKIILLITLTESGRDSAEHNTRYTTKKFNNVLDYLLFEESFVYNELENIINEARIEFFAGRNFSIDFKETTNSLVDPKNIWIKLNFEENQRQNFNNENINLDEILLEGPLSGIGLHGIKKYLDHCIDQKNYLVDQINRADKLWTWLRNNPLHNNRATCHPKKESHRLWADNILNQLI
jgi:hypothetical protein